MMLARFNANGTLDTTYGTNGFVSARFAGTPTTTPGASAATALALDAAGNVLATGFGGSQSMFVARFSPTGAMTSSVVCFAPHLIDYTAHALAARPDGSVVIAGQARDRWHGTPYRFYGVRAVVQVTGGARGQRLRHVGHLGARRARRSAPRASRSTASRSTASCSTASLAGRQYQGVAVRPDGSYVTAALNGAISSFTPASAVDSGFGTGGTTRSATSALHAVRVWPTAASSPAARAPGRRTRSACWSPSSARPALLRPFGTAGVVRLLAGTGNNQGQALTLQSDGRILIAGGAVLSGNVSSFAVARLTAAGLPDTTWAPTGVATTPLGATGYATAIAPSASGFVVAGRRADSAMGNAFMDVVVARYVGGP